MKLSNVLKNLCFSSRNYKDVEVQNIVYDCNKVVKGSVFVCIKGDKFDGHDFAEKAIENGAVCVVCEKNIGLRTDVVVVKVHSSREAICTIFANFYQNPQKKLKFIGVTGTNGKTTTVSLVKHVLENNGIRCGMFGTTGIFLPDEALESSLTTPDPDVFYRVLGDMVSQGVEYVALEVSAHAIALKKMFGITFEVFACTNITQDHLDYFKTMENYAKTKIDFALSEQVKSLVFCSDDKLLSNAFSNKQKQGLSYAISSPSDVFATSINTSISGSSFFVNLLDSVFEVKTALVGDYNVLNTLCALCICSLVGISAKAFCDALLNFKGAKGRMETFRLRNNAYAIVDYAHTPDAMENVLKVLSELANNRLITVFGCGGDRDRSKRPIMGEIAEKFSDLVIVTSDNPRREKPKDITNDICKNMKRFKVVLSREKAIKFALNKSKQGDIVAILGKGHEEYQLIGNKKLIFSDSEQILKENKKMRI